MSTSDSHDAPGFQGTMRAYIWLDEGASLEAGRKRFSWPSPDTGRKAWVKLRGSLSKVRATDLDRLAYGVAAEVWLIDLLEPRYDPYDPDFNALAQASMGIVPRAVHWRHGPIGAKQGRLVERVGSWTREVAAEFARECVTHLARWIKELAKETPTRLRENGASEVDLAELIATSINFIDAQHIEDMDRPLSLMWTAISNLHTDREVRSAASRELYDLVFELFQALELASGAKAFADGDSEAGRQAVSRAVTMDRANQVSDVFGVAARCSDLAALAAFRSVPFAMPAAEKLAPLRRMPFSHVLEQEKTRLGSLISILGTGALASFQFERKKQSEWLRRRLSLPEPAETAEGPPGTKS